MRLTIIGESLAVVRASLKVFRLMLRFTWGFMTILDNLGSLIRVWRQNGGKQKAAEHLKWREAPDETRLSWTNETYRNFPQLLLHLVQFVLLAGSREESRGVAALHPVNLDGRLGGGTGRLLGGVGEPGERSTAASLTLIILAAGLTTDVLSRRACREKRLNVAAKFPNWPGFTPDPDGMFDLSDVSLPANSLAVIQVQRLVWIYSNPVRYAMLIPRNIPLCVFFEL